MKWDDPSSMVPAELLSSSRRMGAPALSTVSLQPFFRSLLGAEQPVDRGAEDVAYRGDRDQNELVVCPREVETCKDELRLRGQHDCRKKCGQEQARKGGQISHDPAARAGVQLFDVL